jgi:hypothetical protein
MHINTPPAKLRRAEQLWGAKPEAPPQRMRLISFKPLVKNSLRGFATIELPIGLKISDIPVLISHNKAWASLPSKPQLDRDGQHKKDINGKPAYTAMLEWRDRDLADRFSQAVVELVKAVHPNAFDDAGGEP